MVAVRVHRLAVPLDRVRLRGVEELRRLAARQRVDLLCLGGEQLLQAAGRVGGNVLVLDRLREQAR
ncbi:hypothetical protein KF840_05885 [bacterium]|nr:hypothetical protein [bacterium]